ncbi:MAG: hypothetical protein E8D46_09485 [Nitrospira sp.]|nr:hypothetical protein [Nitrospira sp.]TKB74087.1 MAG: hypothetical protein E8D46_09485 [Nitrospira sp.]
MLTRAVRICFFLLSFFALIGTVMIVGPGPSFALDPLPRSPRVGSLRIPLLSYNRVPISKLFSDPTSYHLREVRIGGTLRTIETRIMTQGCATPYELTTFSLEDESGTLDVLDKGACGRNRSAVRAPMLTAGDRVDLLVHVVGGTKTDETGVSPEVFVLWIDRTQD